MELVKYFFGTSGSTLLLVHVSSKARYNISCTYLTNVNILTWKHKYLCKMFLFFFRFQPNLWLFNIFFLILLDRKSSFSDRQLFHAERQTDGQTDGRPGTAMQAVAICSYVSAPVYLTTCIHTASRLRRMYELPCKLNIPAFSCTLNRWATTRSNL